jgi:4-hydroxy-4-methyl-2-oxoglutarate aldolase
MTNSKQEDLQLFRKIERRLYVPVISDSLDAMGYRDRAMHPRVRPLREDFAFAGRARTVQWMYMFGKDPNPYEVELEFMDSLGPGDIVIPNSDPKLTNAPWGELMSTAAKHRGARGAVIDSCVRDVKKIFALNFPIFATAIAPLDSAGRGKVVAYDVPIESGGVHIKPGELVIADYDGVIVVPKSIEKEVLRRAFEKVSKENKTREELRKGKLLSEVYAKYGVL